MSIQSSGLSRIHSHGAPIVVVLAHHVVPLDAEAGGRPLELLERLARHGPPVAVPRHHQPARVVQHGQRAAPQRQHVVALAGPRDDAPALDLQRAERVSVSSFCNNFVLRNVSWSLCLCYMVGRYQELHGVPF